MSNALNDEIRQRIEAFADDLAALYQRAFLQTIEGLIGAKAPAAALPHLPSAAPGSAILPSSSSGAARRGPGRPRKAPPPAKVLVGKSSESKGNRRSSKEITLTADRIYRYIQKNPGQSSEQIKKALGIPTNQWTRPVAKLLEAKRLRAEGERRATRYFAI